MTTVHAGTRQTLQGQVFFVLLTWLSKVVCFPAVGLQRRLEDGRSATLGFGASRLSEFKIRKENRKY